MKFRTPMKVSATAAVVLAACAATGSSALASGGSGTVALAGTQPAAASSTPATASVPAGSRIDFSVQLRPRDLAGAQALAKAVSTPGSAQYGHYLTTAQWEQRFSPTAGQVSEVTRFLSSQGFSVGAVSADRLAVDGSGTAQQVERAFSTTLAYHVVNGTRLRLAGRPLSVPAGLASVIVTVSGISQSVAKPASSPQPPPPGFRAAQPCGAYFNQKIDTQLPPFGNGYPANPPWAVCGYVPSQLRSAYNENPSADGTGVKVAIIDAYAAPTLLSDAQTYASRNDPSHPLSGSQFTEVEPSAYRYGDLCGASGWYGEQSLDVEAVHAMAPGADIVYSAAASCINVDLDSALRAVVDGHRADIVTNSYGNPAGDVTEAKGDRDATNNLLVMAADTGISVLFSSGDWFDNYTVTGHVSPTFPADSPWVTGVGGTTTAIGANGNRIGEWGWSTARSMLCNDTAVAGGACTASQRGTWLPISLGLDGGSGGGTSSVYPQPWYQAGVVPTSLSERSSSTPMRVEPDISMEADPATGMLVGETQTFPNGVYYDQYRIGGTSLASPLLAGYMATADQLAGHSLGFLNPVLYALHGTAGAINDVLPAGKLDQSRADYANSLNAESGLIFWTRIIDYEGPEQFCSSATTCSRIDMTLHTTPGYDNMTGLGTPGPGLLGLLSSGH